MDPIFSWRFVVSRTIGAAIFVGLYFLLDMGISGGLILIVIAGTLMEVTHRWDRYGWPEFRWFRRR